MAFDLRQGPPIIPSQFLGRFPEHRKLPTDADLAPGSEKSARFPGAKPFNRASPRLESHLSRIRSSVRTMFGRSDLSEHGHPHPPPPGDRTRTLAKARSTPHPIQAEMRRTMNRTLLLATLSLAQIFCLAADLRARRSHTRSCRILRNKLEIR